MRSALPMLFLILAAGCWPSDPAPPPGPAAAEVPGSHAGDPATKEEKEVARIIQRGAADAGGSPTEWLRWGPNDLDQLTHFDGPEIKIVRVRYASQLPGRPKTVEDKLYGFGYGLTTNPNAPVPLRDNPDGHDWLNLAVAKKKAQEQEALKGPRH